MAQQPLGGDVERHVANVNLPRPDVATGSGAVGSAGQTRGGELRDGDSAIDLLAGLLEGKESAVGVLEGDEAVAFGLAGVLVEDDDGLVEIAVGGEEGAEGVGCGLEAEAADEELAKGGLAVGDGADGVEDIGVPYDGVLEDVEELLLR